MRLTHTAHELIRPDIQPGEVAVDATAGNGFDTIFLAQCVGPSGHVYSFDLQPEALAQTRWRLADQPEQLEQRVTLKGACHSRLTARLPARHHGHVACVMFNLGYLPGGDHSVTTHSTTTLSAIAQATLLLRPGGMISVLGYTAHAGGQQEVDALIAWITTHNSKPVAWQEIDRNGGNPGAPRLFFGRRTV